MTFLGSWKFGFFQLVSRPNIYLKPGFAVLVITFKYFLSVSGALPAHLSLQWLAGHTEPSFGAQDEEHTE